MRYLTIQRKKSFVACLMPMKVYIESPEFGDTKINGVMCVKLGNLKNGETQTFQIPDNQAKVFVIADKLSKGYCNDFFEIPAGNQNIFLSGKNNFNPATGNAFRFDYNNSPEAKAHRKKGVAKGIIVLIICLIIGVVVGVASALLDFSSPSPQEFSYGDMSITLTDDFYEVTDYDAFSICYDSADVAVFVTEDKFADYDGLEDYTAEDYIEDLMDVDDYTLNFCEDTIANLEYDHTSDNTTYTYAAYIFKEEGAFWLITFACEKDYFEQNYIQIYTWGSSVDFKTDSSPSPKEFSYGDMSITLTDEFYEVTDIEQFDICYLSDDITVFVFEDKFADHDGLEGYTIEEYIENYMVFDKFTLTFCENTRAVLDCEYTLDNTAYSDAAYVFKQEDAFWFIIFSGEKDYFEQNYLEIHKWEASIDFKSDSY